RGASHGRQRPAALPPRHPAGCAALYADRTAARPGAGLAHPGRRGDARRGAVGIGLMIFGAREFLNTDVMLAGVFVIGVIGLALEKLVLQKLEEYTVMRWGMMT